MLSDASFPHGFPLQPALTIVPVSRARTAVDSKRYFLVCKRIADILFSVVFIAFVLSWLLPVLSIMIIITSPGPVFFVQRRVGKGGRSFRCYKFRTMYCNELSDAKQCTAEDTRVTPLGRFLRKTNIDEFPQFFQVLAGYMSLVGPRPHMYADCHNFSAIVSGYKFRNLVKPGLTGLAQIKGYYGYAGSRDSVQMRFYWDKQYILRMNWQLDCQIFLVTAAQRLRACTSLLFTRTLYRSNSLPANHF